MPSVYREKQQILHRVLRVMLLLALVAYVPSMWASLTSRLYPLAFVTTIGYLALLGLTLIPASFELRRAVTIAGSFMIGCAVVLSTGYQGAGYLWFVFAVMFSALFERRWIIAAMVSITLLLLALYTTAIAAGYVDHTQSLTASMVIAANILTISGISAYMIFHTLQRLEAALAAQHATSETLQQQLADSERTEQELRELADERNTLLRELHHRVRNNLQTINSLLQLDSANNRSSFMRKLSAIAIANDIFLQHTSDRIVPIHELMEAIEDHLDVFDPSIAIIQDSSIRRHGVCSAASTLTHSLVVLEIISLFHSLQYSAVEVELIEPPQQLVFSPAADGYSAIGATELQQATRSNPVLTGLVPETSLRIELSDTDSITCMYTLQG